MYKGVKTGVGSGLGLGGWDMDLEGCPLCKIGSADPLLVGDKEPSLEFKARVLTNCLIKGSSLVINEAMTDFSK